jgi:hypothetical protein
MIEIIMFAFLGICCCVIIYRLDLIMDKLEIPRWKIK